MEVEPYKLKKKSRFDEHSEYIIEHRKQRWPYHRIAEKIEDFTGNKGIYTHHALKAWCIRHGIKKGVEGN